MQWGETFTVDKVAMISREKRRDDDAEQKGRVVVAQKGKGKAES